MSDYARWWRELPKSHRTLGLIACYVLIFSAAIDVGRALYQVTH